MTTPILLKLVAASALSVAVVGVAVLVDAPRDSSDDAAPLVAAQNKRFQITGRAVGPDGAPVEKAPVKVTRVKKLSGTAGGGDQGFSGGNLDPLDGTGADPLAFQSRRDRSDRYEVVGKAITDADGKFTVRNIEPGGYQLRIGDPDRQPWTISSVRVNDKDLEMGEIKLQAAVGGSSEKEDKKDKGNDRRR